MAELLVRAGASDAALMRRVWASRRPGRPLPAADRLVVDAPTANAEPALTADARKAGVPVLIDPQTYLLQDEQPPDDRWLALPFARADAVTPSILLAPAVADRLVHTCLTYQLDHGASALIPPYVHLGDHADEWQLAQAALWDATSRWLRAQDVQVPVLAVVAVGWRLLDRAAWPQTLPLMEAMRRLGPREVAVAASRVDAGAHPDQRLASFVATVRRFRRLAPVIAWSQGSLGEVAVAAGAVGYETGIGWRERCDLPAFSARRRRRGSGAFGPRPVYLAALKRSIPKGHLEVLLAERRLAPDLLCMDDTCCSRGRESLLGDARLHAIDQRAASLLRLSRAEHPSWRWNALAVHADAGLRLAGRINVLADRHPHVRHVDTTALRAVKVVADTRRYALRHVA